MLESGQGEKVKVKDTDEVTPSAPRQAAARGKVKTKLIVDAGILDQNRERRRRCVAVMDRL